MIAPSQHEGPRYNRYTEVEVIQIKVKKNHLVEVHCYCSALLFLCFCLFVCLYF